MNLPHFLQEGHFAEIGSHAFTAAEIISFARKYDTQYFHLDGEAARNSMFGGLCASGWHTTAVWMRKQRDHAAAILAGLEAKDLASVEFGPSGGFRDLIWPRPVFAGDVISYTNKTVSCRPSASRPGWHVVSGEMGGRNQHGQSVMQFVSIVLVRSPA